MLRTRYATGPHELSATALCRLLENGTHALFGVALGGYKDAQMSLAHRAVKDLKPGMLCLTDRWPARGIVPRLGAKSHKG